MKPWNVSENRSWKGFWLKALARRVRGWLDRLLEEDENKIVSPSNQDSSTNRATCLDDAVAPSNNRKKAELPSWDALRQPGPPEHWLKLVRAGAPELLRSLEAGEVASSSTEKLFENENPAAETPAADLPAWSEAAAPVAKERPRKIIDSAAETSASRMSPLSQVVYRWLRPNTIGQEKKEGVAQTGNDETLLKPADEATQIWSEPAAVNAAKQTRLRQPAAIESEPSALSSKPAEAPLSSLKKLVQQKVLALLPDAFTNPAISKKFAENKNGAAAFFPKKDKLSRPFDLKKEQAASRTSRRSAGFEWPSVDGRLHVRVPQSQRRSRSVSPVPSNSAGWEPLPINAMSLRDRSAKNSRLRATGGENPSINLPASRAVDPQSFDSARWPESEQIDPWPELPEDPRLNESNWREPLRSSDHLRVLDLEQRGGR